MWLFKGVCGERIQDQIRHSGEGIKNPSASPAKDRGAKDLGGQKVGGQKVGGQKTREQKSCHHRGFMSKLEH